MKSPSPRFCTNPLYLIFGDLFTPFSNFEALSVWMGSESLCFNSILPRSDFLRIEKELSIDWYFMEGQILWNSIQSLSFYSFGLCLKAFSFLKKHSSR